MRVRTPYSRRAGDMSAVPASSASTTCAGFGVHLGRTASHTGHTAWRRARLAHTTSGHGSGGFWPRPVPTHASDNGYCWFCGLRLSGAQDPGFRCVQGSPYSPIRHRDGGLLGFRRGHRHRLIPLKERAYCFCLTRKITQGIMQHTLGGALGVLFLNPTVITKAAFCPLSKVSKPELTEVHPKKAKHDGTFPSGVGRLVRSQRFGERKQWDNCRAGIGLPPLVVPSAEAVISSGGPSPDQHVVIVIDRSALGVMVYFDMLIPIRRVVRAGNGKR